MAAFEVIALDTATPQLRAPGASDTYTFPRAVEMPLGTANGVLYLNGSKVVTSGSALTFDGTALTNTRNTTDGSAAALTLNNSGTTGSYATLNQNAGLVTYQQFVDAAGNAGVAGMTFRTTSNHPLVWGVNNSEQMRLTSTGLGIGTNNPAYKLDVAGTARILNGSTEFIVDSFGAVQAPGGVYVNTTGIRTSGINSTGNNLKFRTGNVDDRMIIDASGNLGLGVTPSGWGSAYKAFDLNSKGLSLGGGNESGAVAVSAYWDSVWKYSGNTTYKPVLLDMFDGSFKFNIATASGTAGNAISFTQAMTLDASGNLSIGDTTPTGRFKAVVANSGTLQLAGAFTNNANADFNINIKTSETWVGPSTATPLIFANSGNTERARITSGGSLVVGTAALATTATDGFLYVPTCAGTPTGTPTTQTGTAPIVVDTTNNKLYFYSGGQWRDAGP